MHSHAAVTLYLRYAFASHAYTTWRPERLRLRSALPAPRQRHRNTAPSVHAKAVSVQASGAATARAAWTCRLVAGTRMLLHAEIDIAYTSRRRLSTTHTLDTPAARPRTVHSYPLRPWTSSDFIFEEFGPTQLALHRTRPTMTLGTKDAGITSVSTLTGASATAKTAVMPRGRKEPFFLAA